MTTLLTLLFIGLVSFLALRVLGYLTALAPRCQHRWSVLTEKYPTFAENRWRCSECGLTENYLYDQPPVRTSLEICNMGHAHVVVSEREEWPDVVG